MGRATTSWRVGYSLQENLGFYIIHREQETVFAKGCRLHIQSLNRADIMPARLKRSNRLKVIMHTLGNFQGTISRKVVQRIQHITGRTI